MRVPEARGPLTDELLATLRSGPSCRIPGSITEHATRALDGRDDALHDEDLQLALFCLYELHYSGLDGVDDRWEWDPRLLELRQVLERAFEEWLRAAVPVDLGEAAEARSSEQVARRLFEMAESDDGPSVADFIARKAEPWQLREWLVHKSVYQLKEADPHTWAIPRLDGRPKAALVEIQADEYGGGRLERMHSRMFATTMQEVGLDPGFGAYVDWVPAVSLANVNMMSLFGLNRRLRGAIVGHLAMYEMDSSLPNRKYARGLRRLGLDSPVTDYFDEHVEADAVHEQVAARDLAGALVEQDPALLDDVLFGAASAAFVGGLVGRWQLDRWARGESSLRRSLPPGDDVPVARRTA